MGGSSPPIESDPFSSPPEAKDPPVSTPAMPVVTSLTFWSGHVKIEHVESQLYETFSVEFESLFLPEKKLVTVFFFV